MSNDPQSPSPELTFLERLLFAFALILIAIGILAASGALMSIYL